MADTATRPKVEKTDAEWREQLTQEQYYVARKHGTERAFTSPLNNEKRDGMFKCVACGEPLFKSEDKFDSGTGWPSFYDVTEENNVSIKKDVSFGMVREEVLCKNCRGHLGHVFNDAPGQPTGLRYCINSASLDFVDEDGDKDDQ